MAAGFARGTRTMSKVTMACSWLPKDWEAEMREARNVEQSSSVASFCFVRPFTYAPYLIKISI